jgi:hypothetical protein
VAGSGYRPSTLPASAPDSSPALLVPPEAAAVFLTRIEQLPSDSTGAFVCGDTAEAAGSVLVERGRVCWAVANSMRRRLTDIMRFQREPPLAAEELEQVYADCRKAGRPLGEVLLERGIVTEVGLRSALRQHSAEAIALLSFPPRRCVWQPREHTSYDPKFTFSAAELMVSLGALVDVAATRTARLRLRYALAGAGSGAGFIDAAKTPIPVAAVNEDSISVENLRMLGDWLHGFRAARGAWVDEPRVVSCCWKTGESVVGWFEGTLSFAALCDSSALAAQVISRVMR